MEYQDNIAVEFIQQKAEEAGLLLTRELTLRESNFFRAKEISNASGIVQLLRKSDTIKDGVLNLDAASIPADEHLVLKGVQVKAVFDSDEEIQSSVYQHTTSGLPGAFLNSSLRIKVGDTTLLDEKIEDFLLETASDRIGGDIFYPLKNWKYISGGKEIQMLLVVPEGEKLDPALNTKHFIKVKLVGTAAVLK